jgi:hypothetical protein
MNTYEILKEIYYNIQDGKMTLNEFYDWFEFLESEARFKVKRGLPSLKDFQKF